MRDARAAAGRVALVRVRVAVAAADGLVELVANLRFRRADAGRVGRAALGLRVVRAVLVLRARRRALRAAEVNLRDRAAVELRRDERVAAVLLGNDRAAHDEAALRLEVAHRVFLRLLIGDRIGLPEIEAGDVLRRRGVELHDVDRRARRLDALDAVVRRAINRAARARAGLADPGLVRVERAELVAVDLRLRDLAAEDRLADVDRRLLRVGEAGAREVDARDVALGLVAAARAERLAVVHAVDEVAAARREHALAKVRTNGEVAVVRVREVVLALSDVRRRTGRGGGESQHDPKRAHGAS